MRDLFRDGVAALGRLIKEHEKLVEAGAAMAGIAGYGLCMADHLLWGLALIGLSVGLAYLPQVLRASGGSPPGGDPPAA